MNLTEQQTLLIVAGAGLIIVLALCMVVLYKWIRFCMKKMTGYGQQMHRILYGIKEDKNLKEVENNVDSKSK